ncbi:MAG: metallophosphoesterase [Deltaproteobacteria bacterium]|nr:metallophosphoesterase [Deltaproteobacteria bacterium]
MKNKSHNIFLLIVIALFIFTSIFIACAPLQDSPFSEELLRTERDLNKKSLDRILNIEIDGKIRIAIFTDSHLNYKELDQIIFQINQTANLDFNVNLGDFTNSGYNMEYNQFLDSFVGLNGPTLSVTGNHDALGAGPVLFRKAFGDSNYWFESDTKRFIFFHSAVPEDSEGFKPDWLKKSVDESVKPVIIFSHAQLRDSERFTGNVAQMFSDIVASPKVILILNGHNHIFDLTTDSGTAMLQAPSTDGSEWLLIEIQGTNASITKMKTGEIVSVTLKN